MIPEVSSKTTTCRCQQFATMAIETLKTTEQCGNVIENKGPLWKTWGGSGNVYENKGDPS
jgi:hypothetical protein